MRTKRRDDVLIPLTGSGIFCRQDSQSSRVVVSNSGNMA